MRMARPAAGSLFLLVVVLAATISSTASGQSIWVAGANGNGQLGLNDTTDRDSLTEVLNFADVTMIDAGDLHTVALKSDGTVWTAGSNQWGQLGLSDNTDRDVFTQVPGLTNVVAIATCSFTTMAVKDNGTLWACGRNTWGELGLGTHGPGTEQSSFQQVTDLADVAAVAGGGSHVFVQKENGSIWVVGRNDHGQLGSGDHLEPDRFQALSGVSDIAKLRLGAFFTILVKEDGTLLACGDNRNGQLGLGDTTDRSTFTAVPGVAGIADAAPGGNHALLLKSDGTVMACGPNASGQLGLGDTDQRTSFAAVPGLTGIVALDGGTGAHSMAIDGAGHAWVTGNNASGQLGLGDTTNRSSFTQAPGMDGVVALCGGDSHTIVLTGVVTPGLQFSAPEYAVAEGAGAVRIVVRRVGDAAGMASVSYATTDGTALADEDYAAASGMLTWADGDGTDRHFDVTVLEDLSSEGAETFTATLNNATGAPLGDPSVTTVTITDNEPASLTVQSSNPSSGVSITITPLDNGGQGTGSTPFERAYAYGTTVSLTAPVAAQAGETNYHFAQWSGTPPGTILSDGNRTASFALNASASVTAEYAVNTWTLNVQSTPITGAAISSATGHDGMTDYQKTVDDNATVTLTAPATKTVGEADYHFVQWSGAPAGTEVTDGGLTISFAMNAAATVTAQYAIDTWTLDVLSTPITSVAITSTTTHGGTTGYQKTVNDNTTVALTAPSAKAVSGTDYNFVQWAGAPGDTEVSNSGRTISFVISADAAVTAEYEVAQRTLSVQSLPMTGLTITSTTGHGGETNYQKAVNDNTPVSITAPSEAGGKYFSCWQTAGGTWLTSNPMYAVTLNANLTTVAHYGDLKVLAPTDEGTGIVWGQVYTIRSTGLLSPKAKVKIALYDRSGEHWDLAPAVKNSGVWLWRVGTWKSKTRAVYPTGNDYRIRISTLDDSMWDESDYPFAIGRVTSLTVSGPATVTGGTTAQYTCTAHYDFGEDQDVTALVKWSCTKVRGVKMGKTGLLATVPALVDQPCTVTAAYGKGKPPMTDDLAITITP